MIPSGKECRKICGQLCSTFPAGTQVCCLLSVFSINNLWSCCPSPECDTGIKPLVVMGLGQRWDPAWGTGSPESTVSGERENQSQQHPQIKLSHSTGPVSPRSSSGEIRGRTSLSEADDEMRLSVTVVSSFLEGIK